MRTTQKQYDTLACQLASIGTSWQKVAKYPLYQTTTTFDSNKGFRPRSLLSFVMDELTRDLDGKLKLEEVPESDPKPQSDPVPRRPYSGRPHRFSGLDATPEDGVASYEGPDGEASQKSDAMEALTKEMNRKLKLEGGVTASSEGSRPPEEAIPETEAIHPIRNHSKQSLSLLTMEIFERPPARGDPQETSHSTQVPLCGHLHPQR